MIFEIQSPVTSSTLMYIKFSAKSLHLNTHHISFSFYNLIGSYARPSCESPFVQNWVSKEKVTDKSNSQCQWGIKKFSSFARSVMNINWSEFLQTDESVWFSVKMFHFGLAFTFRFATSPDFVAVSSKAMPSFHFCHSWGDFQRAPKSILDIVIATIKISNINAFSAYTLISLQVSQNKKKKIWSKK